MIERVGAARRGAIIAGLGVGWCVETVELGCRGRETLDELRVPSLEGRLGFCDCLWFRILPRRAATAEAALPPGDTPIRPARMVSARGAVVEIVVVVVAHGRLGARAVPLSSLCAVGALPVLLADLVLEFFDLHREVR